MLKYKNYIIGFVFLILLHTILTQQFSGLTWDKFDKGYASYPGDPSGGIHVFTYVRKAYEDKGIKFLFERINPYLGAPFGVTVGTTFFQNFLFLIVSRFGNELAMFNILIWIGYFFSGISTFLLAWYITKSYFPSIIASLIFTYCPFHIARQTGHLSFANTEWIPLFFLFFLFFYKKANFIRALLFGMVFAIMTSLNAYYGFFGIIAILGFFSILIIQHFRNIGLQDAPKIEKIFWCLAPFWWFGLLAAIIVRLGRAWIYTKKNKLAFFSPRFKNYILLFGIVGVIIPLSMYNFIYEQFIFKNRDVVSKLVPNRGMAEINVYSTRILDYFFPSIYQHYVKGNYEKKVKNNIKKQKSNAVEQTTFIGFIPMLLLLVSFYVYYKNKHKQKSKNEEYWQFWAGVFICLTLVMFFTSLPGRINFKIGPLVTSSDTFLRGQLITPIGIIYKYFPVFRAVVRASIFVQMGVAVLAALILTKWIQKTTPNFVIKYFCFFILIGLILYDFWPKHKPFTLDDVANHPGYQWIKEQPKDNIIAEYPFAPYPGGYKYKYNIWFHDHPIVNFLPSRYTYNYELLSVISNIQDPDAVNFLRELGVRHIIWNESKSLVPLPKGLKLSKEFPEKNMRIYSIDGKSSIDPEDFGNRTVVKKRIKKLLGFRLCSKPGCQEIKFTDNQSIKLENIVYNNEYNTLHPPTCCGQTGKIYYKFRIQKKITNLFLRYYLIYKDNYIKIYLRENGQPFHLIGEDVNKQNIEQHKSLVLTEFMPNREYELKFVLHVSSKLPWDSRVESIRKYRANTNFSNISTYNVRNYYENLKN